MSQYFNAIKKRHIIWLRFNAKFKNAVTSDCRYISKIAIKQNFINSFKPGVHFMGHRQM